MSDGINVENVQSNNPVYSQNITNTNTQTESNPFIFSQELNNLFPNDNQQQTQQQQDQQDLNQNEQQAPQQQEQELPQEEIDKIVNSDPFLKQLQILTDAGYSQEEAIEKVYGNNNPVEEPVQKQEDFLPIPPNLNEFYQNVIQSEQDYKEIQRMAFAPTQQDVANVLKSANLELQPLLTLEQIQQEFDIDEGTSQLVGYMLNALSQLQGVNNFFTQRTIMNEYQNHFRNINSLAGEHRTKVNAQQNLANELDNKIFTELPQLKENAHPAVKTQFENMLKAKAQSVPEHLLTDKKILDKITQDTIKDFKTIYPTLCKKFGIQTQQQPQNLANFQKAQMQNVSSNGLSGSMNAGFDASKYNMSESGSFAKAMNDLFK